MRGNHLSLPARNEQVGCNVNGEVNNFIEPGARGSLIQSRIKEIKNRISAEYKPKLKSARDPSEKARLKSEMQQAIRNAIREEGLTDIDHDPTRLY